MAKLPDGWILVPKMKDAITITIEQRELVTCRHCKHAEPFDKFVMCRLVTKRQRPPDWFCAEGEKED